MAKIVCISKYPPLEGGIAAKTYWLTEALSERGHEIHVVTDPFDASPEYTVQQCDLGATSTVKVHRPVAEIPWHIPDERHRALSLLDIALNVIEEVKPDVIDTGYLVPYGIVGYLASRMTDVPFILRHGGSDIAKFLSKGIWSHLLSRAFAEASLVVTGHAHAELLGRYTSRIAIVPPYIPNPDFFNTSNRCVNSAPILALIGKANYYWRHKGWHRIIEIIKALGDSFQHMIVAQGKGLDDFKTLVSNSDLENAIEWAPFVPPWEMPSLLSRIDALFVFEHDLPFPAFSNLVLEALYSGTTVITDSPHLSELYAKEGLSLGDLPGKILPVNADQPETAAKQLLDFFTAGAAVKSSVAAPPVADFDRYIIANEEALMEAAKLTPKIHF